MELNSQGSYIKMDQKLLSHPPLFFFFFLESKEQCQVSKEHIKIDIVSMTSI